MGVNPKFWGPHLWQFMHITAVQFEPSPDNTAKFIHFYNNLARVLPCDACRYHFNKTIESKYPLTTKVFRSKKTYFKWTYLMHKAVNDYMGTETPSLSTAFTHWTKNKARWTPNIWFFLHTLAINYPHNPTAKDKREFKSFMYSLIAILPKWSVKTMYIIKNGSPNIRPLTNAQLANKKTIFKWMWKFHRAVTIDNKLDNVFTPPYTVIKKYYSYNSGYIV